MFDFSDQVVMITGATGNLGEAVTRAFERGRGQLALVDISADKLYEIYPDLQDSADALLVNCADLTDPDEVDRVMAVTLEKFGRVDVLVNTVGGYRAGLPLHETPIGTWEFMINLNARSIFIACAAVIPVMLEQGRGKIINIAARAGLQGGAGMSAYSASKSAAVRLTESMAAELKDRGINVNCLLPGTLDTPQNREAKPDADHSAWVRPESIAGVILFLASDLARDIHGAAVPVYGRS